MQRERNPKPSRPSTTSRALSVSPMPPATPTGGKWRRGGAASRGRKKHRRLDDIRDVAPPPSPLHGGAGGGESDAEALRRSNRVRRAPVVLDTSPLPSPRLKRPRRGGGEAGSSGSSRRWRKVRQQKEAAAREREEHVDAGSEVWRSRLRDRVKGKAKLEKRRKRLWMEEEEDEEEEVRTVGVGVRDEAEEEARGGLDSQGREMRSREINLTIDLNAEVPEAVEEVTVVEEEEEEDEDEHGKEEEAAVAPGNDQEEGKENEEEDFQEEARNAESSLPVLGVNGDELACGEKNEEDESGASGKKERPDMHDEQNAEESALPVDQQLEEDGCDIGEQADEVRPDEKMDDVAIVVVAEEVPKDKEGKSPVSDEKGGVLDVKEGRRCGLCGGGTDGRPPKVAVQDSAESENEAYEGALASEEPNYDVWDGFGDDPGWLGRLLGPIHDRFGIARVWVHQNCAVWSPEVYFAGLGCLKNVRAALCRGRLLKCSRCGRPGATIGCRVDRCPKTYHLPCSRADACIFDHRKFLIACNDHRHLFQPQGDKYIELLRKMKAKKMKSDMRKISHDAWRKDIEAEEKWLENCGEDEEFLKREGRRLNRDLLRIAPVYIGGSSENKKPYRGWESVAGLNDVIQCMKEVVILPLLYPELFSSLGLTPPRGVLLHGHPGTGKTLVVRALIGACSQGNKRIAYFARKGADCLGKYAGDAERQLRLLFQVAERCQPSIIFFDEIDGLAPCRSRQQDQTHNSVVATLLSLLDGLKSRGSVIVIGATNRPDAVDPALRRPGRFDREIYFPLPTFEDRSAILSLHTKKWPNPVSGTFLSFIASQTVGYAGADLQAICTQAAINALKRTCALQDLLCSAEKGFEHGRLPSLPSIIVEERDWLAALAAAPPPCSQREAGIAANDLFSSPLDSHLVPCLLKPLLHLLISLYLDERIWLPPSLLKASASIKDIVFSTMEKDKLPHTLWSSHLHSLIQQQDIANRIGTILSNYGLLAAELGNHSSMLFGHDQDKNEKFDCCRLKSTGSLMKGGLVHKLSGFRALVAGAPRSGQQHLIRCLLHGFMGQIEIHKLDLATMAQEGNGDIVSGVTQILLKCLNLGRCIIYMPRIDLWAVNKIHELEMENPELDMGSSKLLSSPINMIKCSELWNSFVEQMGSLLASVSTTILATSELKFLDLPSELRQFFSTDVIDCRFAPSEHTVPRFSVNIDGYFSWDQVINSCASRLSQDLVQHYVQLLHDRVHKDNPDEQEKVFATVKNSAPGEYKSSENKKSTILTESPMCFDKRPLNAVSLSDDPSQLATSSTQQEPQSSNTRGQEENVQKIDFQERVPRNPSGRIAKGTESLAIAAFGFQILQHPQFSKLCWVSSKLREGPCTDINGPWKGWPFNSCFLHSSTSPDKPLAGENNVLKSNEKTLCVRGLVAVGLLAYRGVYASVVEVCAVVRKVLELLVGQIHAKILEKKDPYRYFHILSQVAYLDDVVNSWAYTIQKLQTDNRTGVSNKKPKTLGTSCTNEDQSTNHAKSSVQVAPAGCSSEIQDIPVQHTPDQHECHNMICPVDNDHATSTSSRGTVQNNLLQPAFFDVHKSSLTPASTVINYGDSCGITNDGKTCGVTNGEEACKVDDQRPGSHKESVEDSNDLQRIENSISSLGRVDNLGISGNMVSSKAHGDGNELSTSFPLDDVQSGLLFNDPTQHNIKSLSAAKASCLYKCCHTCFSAVYKLVHDILANSMRPNLHCLAVDDMHDILSSWSLNLLAAVRKWYSSQDVAGCEENCGKEQSQEILLEHCACQMVIDVQINELQRHERFRSRECMCHLQSNEDTETTNSESYSLCEPPLRFFFKDGVLMPSDLTAEVVLHCSFKRLCVCSILGAISMFNQTSS